MMDGGYEPDSRTPDKRPNGIQAIWVTLPFEAKILLGVLGTAFTIVGGLCILQAVGMFVTLLSGPTGHTVTWSKWEGQPAPDFAFVDLAGKEVQLSDFHGRRVVVDFWATWCPPCVREIPHFCRLSEDLPQEEVVILGVSQEEPLVVRAFAKDNQVNYTVGTATELPRPYCDITGIPTTFFLDRSGVVEQVLVGYHPYDELKSAATGKRLTAGLSRPIP